MDELYCVVLFQSCLKLTGIGNSESAPISFPAMMKHNSFPKLSHAKLDSDLIVITTVLISSFF